MNDLSHENSILTVNCLLASPFCSWIGAGLVTLLIFLSIALSPHFEVLVVAFVGTFVGDFCWVSWGCCFGFLFYRRHLCSWVQL